MMWRSGISGEDLFYRLAVAIIKLPALKDRAGDLNLLIYSLLVWINRECAAEHYLHRTLKLTGNNKTRAAEAQRFGE